MSTPIVDIECPMTSATAGQYASFKLSDLRGKKVVLYFYPKDSTPGCTTESMGFRDSHAAFIQANTVVFGISRDSLKSHDKFKANLGLPFELISDADELLCQQFEVIKDKIMYGKQVRGIERSTFLIAAQGVLKQEWRKVKVDEHVAQVLSAAQSL